MENPCHAKYLSYEDKAINQQKPVYMLTTCHDAIMIDTQRKQVNGEVIMKLEALKEYNSHMTGGGWGTGRS